MNGIFVALKIQKLVGKRKEPDIEFGKTCALISS